MMGVLRCGGGCVERGNLLQDLCELGRGLYIDLQILTMNVGWSRIGVAIYLVGCRSGFVGGDLEEGHCFETCHIVERFSCLVPVVCIERLSDCRSCGIHYY
jgi:hypothetical protein